MSDCQCSGEELQCVFCTSASAQGVAFTSSGYKVTSTASASSCSDISYEDAWLKAYAIAQTTAEIVAKNDANIIEQTLEIVNEEFNGATGPQGPQGATGPQGPQGATGPSSSSLLTLISDPSHVSNNVYTIDSVGNTSSLYVKNCAITTGTQQWSALGTGLNNLVYTIAVSGTNIYVGGDFTTAGGNTANRIAMYSPDYIILQFNSQTISTLYNNKSGSLVNSYLDNGTTYVTYINNLPILQ